MSKTNCVNCGAAKDTSEIKCPFCGTTYLDLTAIDFASGEPVVCEFVLPKNIRSGSGGKVVMSMLAVPELNEISQTANRVEVYGGMHIGPIASFVESYDVNVGVSFRPVMRSGDGAMFTIRTLKE